MIAIFGYCAKLVRNTLGYTHPLPIGSGSTRLVNNNQPSSQGGPSGVALECTVECSSYNLCLVSLEQASSAEKPTCNNKLAESANVPPLLVLTAAAAAAECSSQFVFCLSSRAASQNLNPKTCQFWHWVVCHSLCSLCHCLW